MALPTPPAPVSPIPNNPFYYPESWFISGPTGPLVVGAGLEISNTGVISATGGGGGGGVTSIIGGPGIGVSGPTGDVTITNTGVISVDAGVGIAITGTAAYVTVNATCLGTVTSVGAGYGLDISSGPNPITESGTIELSNSGAVPGVYTYPSLQVDAKGRILAINSQDAIESVTGAGAITVTPGSNPTVSVALGTTAQVGVVQLSNSLTSTSSLTAATSLAVKNAYDAATGGIPKTCLTGPGALITATALSTPSTLSVGADGQFLKADSAAIGGNGLVWADVCSGTVTLVDTGTGLTGGPITDSGTIALANTAVVPGDYCGANITVDAQGRITAASDGSNCQGTVTQILTAGGITGGPITSSGTISLTATGVAAGPYTSANITVDATGRIISATDGAVPVTGVTGTTPILVDNTDPQAPVVSIQSASTTGLGATQLYNALDSTATNLALTAAQGKNLQDQIDALSVTSNLTLAGTLDAAAGVLLSVTAEGAAAGFVVGSNLPVPSTANQEFFVIVTVAGNYTPPSGVAQDCHQGDWWLSTGTVWEFLDIGYNAPYASTTTPGVVELATDLETQAGTDATRAVTSASLQSKVSDSTNATSSTTIASSTAVKAAYDLAAAAIPKSELLGTGSLITATSAGVPVNLAAGSDGLFLKTDSSAPEGLTWSTVCTGTVTSVDTGTGLTGGPVTTTGTICLADTTVVADSYTNTALTVDQQGRITAAANGDAPVLCCTATAKGDLFVATGAGAVTALPAGDDEYVLSACSTTATGLAWIPAPAAGGTTFSPSTGPTAFPDTVSIAASNLYGTASAIWASGAGNLTAAGDTEFQVNGGGYGVGPTAVVNGDTVQARWAAAAIAGAADGEILVGGIVKGTTTITFSMTVDRAVTGLSFTDLTSQSTSTQVTSNTITPDGYNVPVTLSFSGSVGDPLTSTEVSIDGGAFTTSPQTVTPGQTLQMRGTTGAAGNAAYGVDISMGSGPAATDTWTVNTNAVASIATPSVVSPALAEQNVYAGASTGLPITSSTYTPLNGAGAVQTSSTWEVYRGGYPVAAGTTVSASSAKGSVGTIGTVAAKNAATADPNPSLAQNAFYGKIPQDNALSSTSTPATTYPLFYWADNLSIMGYNDWYIPSSAELLILYYFLKFSSTLNNTTDPTNGSNPYAVAPYASNTPFTSSVPAQTSVSWLQTTGYHAFGNSAAYWWSATERSTNTTNNYILDYTNGLLTATSKNAALNAVAIRRIPIAEYVAAGSPAIGTYLAGGFYGGQISTTANGVADYALILSPAPLGRYGYGGGTWGPSVTVTPNLDYAKFPIGVTISGATSSARGVVIGNNFSSTLYTIPVNSTAWTNAEAIDIPASTYSIVSGYPQTVSVAPFNKTTLPAAQVSSVNTFVSRVRYATTNAAAATSSYSDWSNFRTSNLTVPLPGTAMGGGYFAGQINIGGTIYNLIVAPVTSAGLQGQFGGATPSTIKWSETGSVTAIGNTGWDYYGGDPTTYLRNITAVNGGPSPLGQWCTTSSSGPNAGSFNLSTGGSGTGTGIGGYNDWYIPSFYEMLILYYFLKPGTDSSTAGYGTNPYSVAPYTPNTPYGGAVPAQTTSTLFQTGGPQAFATSANYWMSTPVPGGSWGSAYIMPFNTGAQASTGIANSVYARAMRRQLA